MEAKENGLSSFENPNYCPCHRLDDDINSNTDSLYKKQEVDGLCNMGHGIKGSIDGNATRKSYAFLDMESMGVDINKGPHTEIDAGNVVDNKSILKNTINSQDVKDIQCNIDALHDLYAVPWKKCNQDTINSMCNFKLSENKPDQENKLPPGWEKHEDNDGSYFWHIKSGTIQREIPFENEELEKSDSCHVIEDDSTVDFENSISLTRSSTSIAPDVENEDNSKCENELKRRIYPPSSDHNSTERPIRFAVRSLGWVEICEEDLTPDRSSKAVNKCIVDLSLGKNDLLDVVGRWGDGKDLFMDLDEGALKLFNPENFAILNIQPIHTIRVWGVGRDNGRDFAYVARDRSTRKHMCHVFRCDMPARTIANTLRDICKKIMIERSLQQNLGKIDMNRKSAATRPNNLPTEHRRSLTTNSQFYTSQSFPTPMEEPKKNIRAHYLGCTQVPAATGMDIINESIDKLVNSIPSSEWQPVQISVAPSMISIRHPIDGSLITECRVRYLSFLGIGTAIKHCAFIMHTAQDTFMAHVFHCEPSSGALCKTIEAACKLRYQKCLDAHPQNISRTLMNGESPSSSIGAALKSIVDSFRVRKSKSTDS